MNVHLLWTTVALVVVSSALLACNDSGLSAKPRGNFAQLACLDVNGDGRVNEGDAAEPESLPDFNADSDHDDFDASFVMGVDIPINAAAKGNACTEDAEAAPEFLVTHDLFSDTDVSCDESSKAVLVLGVGGGVDNLRDKDDAAGVRQIANAMINGFEDEDYDTIGVVAGSAFYGAENAHVAMEDWLTNVATVHLDRYPCMGLVTIGFSHGGPIVEVMASRLEGTYGERIIATVVLDRVEEFYGGDLAALPVSTLLINVFQKNDGFGSDPVEAPNVVNFDASGEESPRDGHEGGPMEPIRHVTLDNSEAVRDWIVTTVLEQQSVSRE